MSILTNDDVFALLDVESPTRRQSALLNILRPMAEDAVRQEVGYSIESATYTHYLPNDSEAVGEVEGVDVLNDKVVFQYADESTDLFLPERPVRSITSVYEDRSAQGGQGSGDFGSSTLLTAGTDYYLDYTASGISWSAKLVRINAGWSSRARTIKVTYTAGLSAAELAGDTVVRGPRGNGVTTLKYAALLAAAINFKESSGIQGSNIGPITSERLADYAVTYGSEAQNLFGFRMTLPQKVKDLLADFKRMSI